MQEPTHAFAVQLREEMQFHGIPCAAIEINKHPEHTENFQFTFVFPRILTALNAAIKNEQTPESVDAIITDMKARQDFCDEVREQFAQLMLAAVQKYANDKKEAQDNVKH